ncbi:MAG: GNAT family N-acetyltransferase [candidate division Zixibacteria bacterium]|nr:GNAT family N-acetyltransferase [candidate division Zixibacteria bacterium]
MDPAEVAALYADSGLDRPVNDLERIGKMLTHANLVLTARDGAKLVGVSRSLTDFSYCCYLSDLAVARAYQKLGIGQELIRRTQEYLGDEVMILLLAAPQARQYYPHIGFTKNDDAWFLPRAR